jgi:hypothetical protein
VVELARQSTAIFNAIDYGGFADLAIASLAYALRLPYLTASTYSNFFQVTTTDGSQATEECACCRMASRIGLSVTARTARIAGKVFARAVGGQAFAVAAL